MVLCCCSFLCYLLNICDQALSQDRWFPKNSNEAGKRSREQIMGGEVEEIGILYPRQKEDQRTSYCSETPTWGCGKVNVGLFSQMTSKKIRGITFKLCQRRFSLNIRKNLFTKMVVKHWRRLSREWWKHHSCVINPMTGVRLSMATGFSEGTGKEARGETLYIKTWIV